MKSVNINSPDAEFEKLCDIQAGGASVTFLRKYTTHPSGKVSCEDFELDAKTPYVVTGTVGDCVQTTADTPATTINIVETVENTSLGGVIPAGLHSYSITNVGSANGVVNGQVLPPTATVSATAYFDPVTNQYKRLTGVNYSAVGTEFLIVQVP